MRKDEMIKMNIILVDISSIDLWSKEQEIKFEITIRKINFRHSGFDDGIFSTKVINIQDACDLLLDYVENKDIDNVIFNLDIDSQGNVIDNKEKNNKNNIDLKELFFEQLIQKT